MAMPISSEEFEKKCNSKVAVAASYEKDANSRTEMENVGKVICRCMVDQAADPRILHKVMTVAAQSIPVYTVAR